MIPGLLSGFAFALCIASINLTDVVRAILLFYLSPLWSSFLGILALKERLTISRVAALLLAFTGLYFSARGRKRAAGTAQSRRLVRVDLGNVLVGRLAQAFSGRRAQRRREITIFVFFALLLSLALLFWQQGNFDSIPGPPELIRGWYWIMLVALLILPICYLTVWPATVLSPGRVGMLLMVEVIVDVGPAAMLTDEPFGLREYFGAALIISAGIVEVIRQQKVAGSVIVNGQASLEEKCHE